MKDKYILRVKVNSDRPDFRVFGAYFFGDDYHNYDSEGNSSSVSSREWTELYMHSRQNKDLWFDIDKVDENNTSILEVTSDKIENVNIIAYFLAKETDGIVLDNTDRPISLEILKMKMGDFDLEKRLLFADQSIWRKSTEANPYPNIEINSHK